MTWTKEEKEEVKEIKDAILSLDRAARGYNGNLGFLAEIKKNTEFRTNFNSAMNKIYWAVAGTVLIGAGNLLLQLWLHINSTPTH